MAFSAASFNLAWEDRHKELVQTSKPLENEEMYLVEHVSSPTCRQSQRENGVSYPSSNDRRSSTRTSARLAPRARPSATT